MILCKRKRDSKRRTVQSTYIENSPSIRMGCELTEIHIICIGCCVYAFRDER